jgi:hypothetical protein
LVLSKDGGNLKKSLSQKRLESNSSFPKIIKDGILLPLGKLNIELAIPFHF